jgi:hypothetical protein
LTLSDVRLRRGFGVLRRAEEPAFEMIEIMGGEEAKAASIVDHDASRFLAGFDDVCVGHKDSCRRHRRRP